MSLCDSVSIWLISTGNTNKKNIDEFLSDSTNAARTIPPLAAQNDDTSTEWISCWVIFIENLGLSSRLIRVDVTYTTAQVEEFNAR